MNKERRPIFQPNEISEDTVVSMRTRILTAVIGIIIVLPAFLLGDWFFYGLMVAISILSVIEIVRCAKRKYSKVLYITALILAFLTLTWSILRDLAGGQIVQGWRLYDSYSEIYISITIIFVGLCLAAFTVLIDKGFTVVDACFIFTMVLLIAIGLQSALFLRYFPSYLYHYPPNADPVVTPYFNLYDNLESSILILFVVVGACLNDAFAYFVGIFFGRNKLNERISPKKTWEGFFGGVILTSMVLAGVAFLFACVNEGKHAILKGFLDLEHWYNIIVVSFIIPLAAVLGDLVFSSIKRFYGIKDFSNVLPGHGGVLDRLDSIIFASISVALYLLIFASIQNGNGGFRLP